jgi:hypothetical protein
MILPRRLFLLADGSFCEEDHPKQRMNFRPKGFIIPDAEAERIGLKAYLDQTGWGDKAAEPGSKQVITEEKTQEALEEAQEAEAVESKAVVQGETEDKAVDAPGPGLHVQSESRRQRGR